MPASTSLSTVATTAAAGGSAAVAAGRRVLRPLQPRRRCAAVAPSRGPPAPRAADGDANQKVDSEVADETTEQFKAFDRDSEGNIVNADGKAFKDMLDPDSWVMKMQAEYEAGAAHVLRHGVVLSLRSCWMPMLATS